MAALCSRCCRCHRAPRAASTRWRGDAVGHGQDRAAQEGAGAVGGSGSVVPQGRVLRPQLPLHSRPAVSRSQPGVWLSAARAALPLTLPFPPQPPRRAASTSVAWCPRVPPALCAPLCPRGPAGGCTCVMRPRGSPGGDARGCGCVAVPGPWGCPWGSGCSRSPPQCCVRGVLGVRHAAGGGCGPTGGVGLGAAWGWGQCGCGVRLGYAHGLLLCSSCWCRFWEWGVPEVRGCCPSCWALTTNPLRAGFATLGS